MTIHPRPDQEVKIQEAMRVGLIHSAEEVIDVGLESLRKRLVEQAGSGQPGQAHPRARGRKSLVEVCAMVSGLTDDVDFDRNPSAGRPVDIS